MNVFELIKEKIKNCDIEYPYFAQCDNNEPIKNQILNILDEVAQEYNNGWIPCSERMPELNQVCMWTVNKEKYPDAPYDIILGTYHLDLTYDIWKEWALAWQPLPTPYKEGGTE